MSNRLGFRLLVALVVAGAVWYGKRGEQAGATGTTGVGPAAPAPSAPIHGSIGFRDAEHLHEHFQKHGREFGSLTEAGYLAAAQQLRDQPAGGTILQEVRADGVVTRFDRTTGAFLAFDPDLTIRTFFKPNDGERYYLRQLARGQSE